MKALTLTQPWATLVAVREKSIETRSWGTSHRGPIAIHAAKGLAGMTKAQLELLVDQEPFAEALWPHLSGYTAKERVADLPRGEIIAIADLTAVVPTGKTMEAKLREQGFNPPGLLTEQERAFGDYTSGRYAWVLERVARIYDGIECKGALGLWDVPGDVLDELAAIDDRAAV